MTRWGVLSANGSDAAFWSTSGNLVSGNGDDYSDVFVRAMVPGFTELVSVSSDGMKGNHASGIPSGLGGPGIAISRNSRYVAFTSAAENLVPVASWKAGDIFLGDRLAGAPEQIRLAAHEGA